MFTGIIECAAAVDSVQAGTDTGRLVLRGVPFTADLTRGESIAVNGCCLTVTEAIDGAVSFDLLAETLRVTNLGDLKPGSLVNLERALRVGDRLSGHFVQGHIDTTAEVVALSAEGQDHRLEIALAPAFQRNIIPRGSIAIDGISLTVAETSRAGLVSWIIPHTAAVTNLHTRKPGERVNIEFDIIGKYVHRHLDGGHQ